MILVPLSFVAAVVMMAFTARWWLWKLRYIKLLANKKLLDSFDAEAVLPSQTLRDVRRADGGDQGNKIVALHFLRGFAEDIEAQILGALGVSVVYTALFLITVMMYEQARLAASAPAGTPVGWIDAMRSIAKSIPALYVNVLPILGGVCWQLASISTLSKAVYRCRAILQK